LTACRAYEVEFLRAERQALEIGDGGGGGPGPRAGQGRGEAKRRPDAGACERFGRMRTGGADVDGQGEFAPDQAQPIGEILGRALQKEVGAGMGRAQRPIEASGDQRAIEEARRGGRNSHIGRYAAKAKLAQRRTRA
jgi:hypothetical protein